MPDSKKEKTTSCPGRGTMLKNIADLDKKIFKRLVSRRYRTIIGKSEEPVSIEKERVSKEKDIKEFFEKINLGEDFLPARYLKQGAAKSKAVCRIVTPDSLGTGSLIADGNFIMTNNHVLESLSVAGDSVAEFGYETGSNTIRIALKPKDFFITDRTLDFTIVACDSTNLEGIEPIPLLRNPATVTRYEQVNIIQHPRGRKKEIAIHNNQVKRVHDRVLHYETDTEPGSSGSPVFNNDWDLVALHHAGWQEERKRATNEGIRMSAIVSHLIGENEKESSCREGLGTILRTIPDSSPYLGFFDVHGAENKNIHEIEIPDFTGNTDFADIGFWNIEHFNNSVSNNRIRDIADIVSRLSMDVLGLVEVQNDAMDRLVNELATRGDAAGYVYLNAPGSQDLAVLFDMDTTTVELNTDIPQRHESRLNKRTASGKTAFPREPLFAHCSIHEGNGEPIEFIMILVHLKAFGDAQSRARRRLASEILTQIIEDIREIEKLPVVLGGDFNERLDTDVLKALAESPDLFSLTADDATTDAISYVGRSHRSLIDHIVVSDDVKTGDLMGDDAAIVRLDKTVQNFTKDISDHVPIVFRMVYRENPIDLDEPSRPDASRIPIPERAESVTLEFE